MTSRSRRFEDDAALLQNGDFTLQELGELLSGDSPDQLGRLLLEYLMSDPQPEVVRLLVRLGADVNVQDNHEEIWSGMTPLTWAGNLAVAEVLVAAGARVSCEKGVDTSMHRAASKGELELLRFLLDKADGRSALMHFDDLERTPLHYAVSDGRLEAARLLLESGADPNALVQVERDDRIGDPPLRSAVQEGRPEMVQLLLHYGADPDRPGWMWNTARGDAAEASPEIARLLEIPSLAHPQRTHHLPGLTEQLLHDLSHYGLSGTKLNWIQATRRGQPRQIRGLALQPCGDLLVVDAEEIVARGAWDFIGLTVDLDFRAFWTELVRADGHCLLRTEAIPAHIWDSLTQNQQSWIEMDGRNQRWRPGPAYKLLVEEKPLPS